MTKQRVGFPKFGVADDDVLVQDSLTQAAGIEAVGATDPGNPLIDADGFDPNGGQARAYLLNNMGFSAFTYEQLFDGGTFSIEIDTAFIKKDFLPAATVYPFSRTQMWLQKYTAGHFQFRHIAVPNTANIEISSVGKGAKTRIDIISRRGFCDFFIDGLLLSRGVIGNNAGGRGNFRTHYAGALTTSNGSSGFKIKNYQLSKRAQLLPISPEYGSIGFIGGSYVVQGSFPVYAGARVGEHNPWDAGYGFDDSDVALTSGGSFDDVGMIPTFIRELSKRGIWTAGNKNYARSGAKVSNGVLPTKQTEMLAKNNSSLKVIFTDTGVNDAASLAVLPDDFDTQFKLMLTEANDNGVRHYCYNTIASLRANPIYRTTAFDAHLDALNVKVNAFKAWALTQGFTMKMHLSDDFTKLGGHNPDLTKFKDNDIHPNESGSYLKGRWKADALFGDIS